MSASITQSYDASSASSSSDNESDDFQDEQPKKKSHKKQTGKGAKAKKPPAKPSATRKIKLKGSHAVRLVDASIDADPPDCPAIQSSSGRIRLPSNGEPGVV
jgi:hypothetical protein